MVKAAIAIAVGYKNSTRRHVKLRKTFRESKVATRSSRTPWHGSPRRAPPGEVHRGLDGPNAIILGTTTWWCPQRCSATSSGAGRKMTVKAGVVQGKLVDAKSLAALADMPGLPELRGCWWHDRGPATKLVRLLSTPGGQIARVLRRSRRRRPSGPRPRSVRFSTFCCAANGAPLKDRTFMADLNAIADQLSSLTSCRRLSS